MHIEWLQVRNVRNLSNLRLEPDPALNVVSGPNGSGKTALLEAVHILSRCRSFRTSGIDRVIRYQQKELQVSAGLRLPDQSTAVTGVARSRGSIHIRYNKRTIRKVSEQAAQVPVITITPDIHGMVSGSPVFRRRWLDWAMFHVKPAYIETWRDYHKALKNRNSLLRRRVIDQLETWEQAMWLSARTINAQRNAFLAELSAEMANISQRLEIPQTELVYECGWRSGVDLDRFLEEHRQGDLERGITRHGIHRSDIVIRQGGRDIGHFYSRGQTKLCIIALSLAQDRVFRLRTGRSPIILVDDLQAELDLTSQRQVLEVLAGQGVQVFITTTGKMPSHRQTPTRMFHVEQGSLSQVSAAAATKAAKCI